MPRVWLVICSWLLAGSAVAQTYIQVEAQPTLAEAVAAAEGYEGLTEDVSGFRLGGSWYAITLGPYTEEEQAQADLRLLRSAGRIPADAYITTSEDYGPRYYPVEGEAPEARAAALAEPEPDLPGETPAEARRAEQEEMAPDLLAGLEIRRPERDRSGFYVDGSGAVLTTHEAVRACQRVTLDQTVEAEIAAADETLGLALLRPQAGLSPIRYARFRMSPPDNSEIAVAGYPLGGVLPAPSLNFGRLEEARTPGANAVLRLLVPESPGETGGPVLDGEGSVVGILQPQGDGPLPEEAALATAAGTIAEFLSAAGLSAAASQDGAEVPPEELTRLAADMTVLVGCWN